MTALRLRALTCSWLVALASGCVGETLVGISGPPGSLPPATTSPADYAARARGIRAEAIQRVHEARVIGDVDGDGLDDFFVLGDRGLGPKPFTGAGTAEDLVHLFYGRRDFPEQVTTSDAEAAFARLNVTPIGDVNGDRLADFVLSQDGVWTQQGDALWFVFGRRERLRDPVDLEAIGVRWDMPPPSAAFGRNKSVERLGDIDGDGFDDLLVSDSLYDRGSNIAASERRYIVAGRRSGWPAGLFEARWAAACYDVSNPDEPHVRAAGDLDGDGFDDLVAISSWHDPISAKAWSALIGFYGSPDRFTSLQLSNADVTWTARDRLLGIRGDIDGDGRVDLIGEPVSPPAGSRWQPIAVEYGAPARVTGDVSFTPELVLEYDYDGGWPELFSADIDGDALPEILLGSPTYMKADKFGAILALRGTNQRLIGTRQIGAADVLIEGVPLPDHGMGAVIGGEVDVSGDIDGDGARDVLAGVPSLTNDSALLSYGAVFLIPSTPGRPH